MKIDCSKYSQTLEKLKHHIEKDKDLSYSISMLASVSSCPALACTLKAIERHGKTPALINQYKSLVSFYGYSEVIGLDGELFNID